MTLDWKPLVELIRGCQRFVLSSHVRPDADAIGSELGLAHILQALGKTVRIVNPSAPPPNLGFLDPTKRVLKYGDGMTSDQMRDTDAHIVVDTSAWTQLQEIGTVLKTTPARKGVIDHHVSSDDLGGIVVKDTTAAATGELIFELAQYLDVKLSLEAANALYCAIATDTGWFRFPSTTGRTMKIVGQLIDLGVEPASLYQQLYEQQTKARLRLFGRVLTRIVVDGDGKVAYLWVAQRDFRETSAVPADTEDLVNECLKIAGVKAAFIAIEQLNGAVKVSFRSRSGIDVATVAEKFNGGGHKQAAGAVIQGQLADVMARVLPNVIQAAGA